MNTRIRLFITQGSSNSRMALDNLRTYLEEYGVKDPAIEVIDVSEKPEKALKNGIFITPAVLFGDDDSSVLVYGNLSRRESLEPVLRRIVG